MLQQQITRRPTEIIKYKVVNYYQPLAVCNNYRIFMHYCIMKINNVCLTLWIQREVCSSLFFSFYIGAIIYPYSEYSDGDGPILYSYVSCIGHEDGLADCQKQGYDDIYSCARTRLTGLLWFDGNKFK